MFSKALRSRYRQGKSVEDSSKIVLEEVGDVNEALDVENIELQEKEEDNVQVTNLVTIFHAFSSHDFSSLITIQAS